MNMLLSDGMLIKVPFNIWILNRNIDLFKLFWSCYILGL